MRLIPRALAMAVTMPRGTHVPDLFDRHRRLTPLVDTLTASIPACWRSRMNLRSISATLPSTVTRIKPETFLAEKLAAEPYSRTLGR